MKLSLSGSVTVVAALCAGGQACAQAVTDYNLPAQPLARSLTAVGTQGRANIVFTPSTVAGYRADALRGRYTVEAALGQLLQDTGLEAVRSSGEAYIIRPKSKSRINVPEVSTPQTTVPAAVPAPEVEVPIVIVTGYRHSYRQSLHIKRTYTGMIDSIIAEDIVKFPDNNLAEAAQRVSGVAIARDQGEGRSISVRGLGPEYTRVEINGMETQAATDGLTQGVNRGRGFDFNVFPSELFSRIDVKKTSAADQPEGSLGATVALRPPKPFDQEGARFVMGVQGSYNDLNAQSGTRASFLVSNRFAEDRLGFLLAAAYAHTPLRVQGVNSGGWEPSTTNGGFCKPTSGTGGICDVPESDLAASLEAYETLSQSGTYHPRFYRYTDLIGHTGRLGLTSTLQWRLSEDTSLDVNVLASRFKTRRDDYFLEAIGFSRPAAQGGKPEIVPRRVEVDANGTVVYGVFDNVDIRSELAFEDFKTDFAQATAILHHKLSDNLTLKTYVGRSKSRFDNRLEITAHIDRYNVDGYMFDIREGGAFRPVLNYGFDVTDPAQWYFGPAVLQPGGTGPVGPEIRLRPNSVRNEFDVAQVALNYRLSDDYRLDMGVQRKTYRYRSMAYRFALGESGWPEAGVGMDILTREHCGLEHISPPEGTPLCWRVPDLRVFIDEYDLFANSGRTLLSQTASAARVHNHHVTEDSTAVYALLRGSGIFMGKPVRVVTGVRGVETRQRSQYYTNVPVEVEPDGYLITRSARTYTDVLPSFNVAFEVNAHTILRFSAARVMARPPLSSLAAITSLTVADGRREVMTGNPNVDPVRSSTFDLSYEWYPDKDSLFSAGFFYKDISTYIQNVTYLAPFSSTGLPASLLEGTGAAAGDEFTITSIVNTPGGPLHGYEISYQAPLRFLPEMFTGLGLNLNYTFVISKIDYRVRTPQGADTVRADLINLSRNAYNATLYYERGRLQARIAANYRDKYLTAVPGTHGSDASGVQAARYWDMSVAYRLTPKVVISLEGLNLTDERSVTWDHTDRQLMVDGRLSGRQYYFGFRYTY
ncbi:MAG: TonB-dependent receptor [Asticcacaulis sp.]